ncbi:MAG: MFS transporter [Bacteroidota bacterium]
MPLARLRLLLGAYPRVFWTLVVGTFVNRTGLVVLPFLALFLTEERSFGVVQATLAVSLYGGGTFAGGFAGGWASDRFGRRPVFLTSLLGGAVLVGVLPFMPTYPGILAVTFGFGFVGEMYRPAVTAAVADLVPEAQQPQAFALVYWAINLGAAVGPALGGWLATRSYLALFVLDGATMLAYAVLIAVAVPETRPEAAGPEAAYRPRLGAVFRDGTLAVIALVVLLVGVGFVQLFTSLPLSMTAAGLSELDYGLVVTVNGGLIVLVGIPVAAWAGRSLPGLALPAAVALMAVGLAMNAAADTFAAFALIAVVWTLGEMAFLPIVPTVVARMAPADLQGSYQGAQHAGWGLAKMIGPVLGGAVIAGYGHATLWLGAGALVLVAAVLLVAIQPVLRRRLGAAPAVAT